MPALPPPRPSVFLLALLGLFLGGCASDPDRRPRPPGGAGQHAPLPTLVGQTEFFDGQILVELRMGAMAGFNRNGDGPGRGGFRAPGDGSLRDAAKAGGFGRRGGPLAGDGERRQGPPGAMARMGARGAGPPVMIHLRFTNRGTTPVELHVVDFLSPLGNFVVSPEKIALAPGESAEAEPMSSALAREAGDGEIVLQLQSDGRRETRSVPLTRENPPDSESENSDQAL